MKILRKGDDFVKMKDKTLEDIVKINSMTKDGWNFSPKKAYKEFYKAEKTATEIKAETKKEKKEKEKKNTTREKELKEQKRKYQEKKSQKKKKR
jgi:hypothetical protein